MKKPATYAAILAFLFVAIYGVIGDRGSTAGHPVNPADAPVSNTGAKTGDRGKPMVKRDIQTLLDRKSFVNLTHKSFDADFKGQVVHVDTSLDISLQNFILKKIEGVSSRYIGIVAMEPSTGRILAMVGHDKTNPNNNPCIDNRFPAASIFKIITASAAVEKLGFNPDSELTYTGGKHTLYKSQLKDRTKRYAHRITFQDSFAQSVNPVFGKIGALYLGSSTLKKYATAFGFNRRIGFEIPLPPSLVTLSDEPYQWAEVASGFNRQTTMSPLHGALIISAILNQGKLIEPTIVDQIIDEKGHTLYRGRLATVNQVITPKASRLINDLMEATIQSGTGRKAFRGYQHDHVLSKLNIGGKTGSIANDARDAHYDWFVGFAEEKKGGEKIAISVVVAHEKHVGTRATHYARMAIKHYFGNYFVNNETKKDTGHSS